MFDQSQIVFTFCIGLFAGILITYLVMSAIWLTHFARGLKVNEQVSGTWLQRIFTRLDERAVERKVKNLKQRLDQINEITVEDNDG